MIQPPLHPPTNPTTPPPPTSSPLLPLGQALSLSSSPPTAHTHTRPAQPRSSALLATSAPAALPYGSGYVPSCSPTGRVWLSDRRGPLEHFRMKSLLLSTTRVSILQASTILSSFITEQLERELEREELLVQGKITADELDEQNASWEEREWNLRWKSYPKRALNALYRFHIVTLLSRFYETAVCQYILQVLPPTLDRLTKDPFQSAIRKKERLARFERHGPSRLLLSSSTGAGGDGSGSSGGGGKGGDDIQSRFDLGKRMFYTCFYSNVIAFLADHTVQQAILAYGYYIYYRQKKKAIRYRRLQKEEQRLLAKNDTQNNPPPTKQSPRNGSPYTEQAQNSTTASNASTLSSTGDDNSHYTSSDGSDFGDGERGGILYSFGHRSARIAVGRGVGLVAASVGGGLGSMVYPGWGTTVGIQLGDALIGNLLDE